MEKRRVVITGMGAVTPVGIGTEEFWDALLAGKSGIAPITEFDATDFPVKIAGEVKGFDPEKYVGDKKAVRHMDRNAQFAVAAAKMAVNDAKLDMANEDPNRVGTIIGTGIGGIKTMEDTVHRIDTRGSAKVNPFAVPMMIANMASGQISITFGLMGPVLADVTACASGNNAIGRATRMIQYGDADVMFAGGTEAAVAKTPMAGFAAMKALSSRDCPPEEASCPFDIRRDGFVLSEGSGVLILEELEHAKTEAHIFMLKLSATAQMVMHTILQLQDRMANLQHAACRKLSMMQEFLRKTSITSMRMAHPQVLTTRTKPRQSRKYLENMPMISLSIQQNP